MFLSVNVCLCVCIHDYSQTNKGISIIFYGVAPDQEKK